MTGLADSRGSFDRRQGVPHRARRQQRRASRRRLRLPLRQQHRGRHRRRERRRVRACQAARRGVRHRHHVHVLQRQSLADPREDRGASAQPRRGGELHAGTHEPIFQDTLREAGLNPFLFEMANIRDQASWVHNLEHAKATGKARANLVRMSVARARMLEPLFKIDVPLTHAAVVVGGGVAGMTAAGALGDMGHEMHLIERSGKLGGLALELGDTIKGNDPAELVKRLEQKLVDSPNVESISRPSSPISTASSATSRASSRRRTASARRSITASSWWPRARARSPRALTSARARRSSRGSIWSAC